MSKNRVCIFFYSESIHFDFFKRINYIFTSLYVCLFGPHLLNNYHLVYYSQLHCNTWR